LRGGGRLARVETYVGERLITTSAPFDMSLMTLAGRPSATYGFLPLSSREPALDEALYLPQHPQGALKKVSVIGCRVSTPKTDGLAPGSDFGHQCDTEPGSSGSPVLDLTNQVVGLHHLGSCTSDEGENLAVLMSQIVPLLPPAATTFALREARVTPQGGFLALGGVLTLGLGSNGIDPLAEPVTLTLTDADGPFYSVTLPPGAMHRQGSSFLFTDNKGTLANGLRSLRLKPGTPGSVQVFATARGADLGGADRQEVTITLQIGDDTGAQTVLLRRVAQGFLFP
jgi:hypothetical protein